MGVKKMPEFCGRLLWMARISNDRHLVVDCVYCHIAYYANLFKACIQPKVRPHPLIYCPIIYCMYLQLSFWISKQFSRPARPQQQDHGTPA